MRMIRFCRSYIFVLALFVFLSFSREIKAETDFKDETYPYKDIVTILIEPKVSATFGKSNNTNTRKYVEFAQEELFRQFQTEVFAPHYKGKRITSIDGVMKYGDFDMAKKNQHYLKSLKTLDIKTYEKEKKKGIIQILAYSHVEKAIEEKLGQDMRALQASNPQEYKRLMDSYIYTYVDVVYTLDITEIATYGSTYGGYTRGGYTRTYTVDKVTTKKVKMTDPDTGITKEFIIEESTPEERSEWVEKYWVPEKFYFEKDHSGNHFFMKDTKTGKLLWDYSGYSFTKENKYKTYLSAQSGLNFRMNHLLKEIKNKNLAEPLYPEISMSDIQFSKEKRDYYYEQPETPEHFEEIQNEKKSGKSEK